MRRGLRINNVSKLGLIGKWLNRGGMSGNVLFDDTGINNLVARDTNYEYGTGNNGQSARAVRNTATTNAWLQDNIAVGLRGKSGFSIFIRAETANSNRVFFTVDSTNQNEIIYCVYDTDATLRVVLGDGSSTDRLTYRSTDTVPIGAGFKTFSISGELGNKNVEMFYNGAKMAGSITIDATVQNAFHSSLFRSAVLGRASSSSAGWSNLCDNILLYNRPLHPATIKKIQNFQRTH